MLQYEAVILHLCLDCVNQPKEFVDNVCFNVAIKTNNRVQKKIRQ